MAPSGRYACLTTRPSLVPVRKLLEHVDGHVRLLVFLHVRSMNFLGSSVAACKGNRFSTALTMFWWSNADNCRYLDGDIVDIVS